ncbi:hypothetical protein JOC86_002090 [Bacillus pakistanensis]|uniref:Uncharacterized protein n=1 Tax=Rossellomorea pakistanensis TaxID=992288 RepID=A0ABS2NCJ2_9BACI|nr:hypothetical protein [Bacillus pakistanensis]MBM7585548.1 hypothetical protein [Bacillus pakistanensis]
MGFIEVFGWTITLIYRNNFYLVIGSNLKIESNGKDGGRSEEYNSFLSFE